MIVDNEITIKMRRQNPEFYIRKDLDKIVEYIDECQSLSKEIRCVELEDIFGDTIDALNLNEISPKGFENFMSTKYTCPMRYFRGFYDYVKQEEEKKGRIFSESFLTFSKHCDVDLFTVAWVAKIYSILDNIMGVQNHKCFFLIATQNALDLMLLFAEGVVISNEL